MSRKKVILSYGMGVESSVILHRWLSRPQCRDFELSDLTVLTAMTGDEFPDTRRQVVQHILPLLRQHKVRYVQIARAGLLKEDGVVTLSDTDQPTDVCIEGVFKLSQELMLAGTVPQVANGRRWCSMKFKGEPIDGWVRANIGNDAYTHVIGFNSEEVKRSDKDQVYGGAAFENRTASYPLIEWGWGRLACEAYLQHFCKEAWKKSCCTFCPFSRGQEHILERYRDHPDEASRALLLEHLCLALNPNMVLFGNKSLFDVLNADCNEAALAAFHCRLAETQYNLYRVRRIQWAKTNFWRDVAVLDTGSKAVMDAEFAALFGEVEPNHYGIREYESVARRRTSRKLFPLIEERYAVAPVGAISKCGHKNFPLRWKELRAKKAAVPV